MATFRVSKISNGGFELWIDNVYTNVDDSSADHYPHPLGWDNLSGDGDSHFTKETNIKHSGNVALKVISNGIAGALYTAESQVQSTSYTLNFWFYVHIQGDSNDVVIRQYDVDGNTTDSVIDSNIGQRTTVVWTEVTKTFGKGAGNNLVLNSDTVKIRVFIRCGNSNAVIYYDDFKLLGETLTLPRGFILPVDETETTLQKSGYTSSGEIKAATSYNEPLKKFKLGVSRIDDTDYTNLFNFLELTDIDYTYGTLLFTDDDDNEYWGKFNWHRFVAAGESYQNIAASLTFDELHFSFTKSSIVLVEFDSFKEKSWGRLTPNGDTIINDEGTDFTYKDYFTQGKFPEIIEEVDVLKGGFGSVSNITLGLNNSNNLIKELLKVSLINTDVSIYELESVGGTLKRSNAVLKYKGVVSPKGVVQKEENSIEIQLIDSFFKKDVSILKKRIKKEGDSVNHSKGNYPNADDSAVDQWVPIVFGKNSVYRTDPGESYIRAIQPNITSPALLIDINKQEYIYADHPVATPSGELIPVDTDVNNIKNNIGATFLYDEGAESLLPLYINADNPQPVAYYDGESGEGTERYIITIPTDTPCVQGFILPEVVSEIGQLYENVGEIKMTEDDGRRMIDDNKLSETGVNVKSFTHFTKDYEIVWLKFPEMDIDPDPLTGGLFLEIKAAFPGGSGCFLIRTTGEEEVCQEINYLDSLIWKPESTIVIGYDEDTSFVTRNPHIYRIRKSRAQMAEPGRNEPEPSIPNRNEWFIFNPASNKMTFRSAPLTKKFMVNIVGGIETDEEQAMKQWVEAHQRWVPLNFNPADGGIYHAQWDVHRTGWIRTYVLDGNYSGLPMPPLNWQNLANEGDGTGHAEYEKFLFNKERLAKYEIGIMGWDGLQIESVWLRGHDMYWKGGKTHAPFLWKFERWLEKWGKYTKPLREQIRDKQAEFIRDKQEIDEKSNTGPVQMILDGYTDTNLTTGTVVQDPVGHMKYMMTYRGKFTEDVQWDSTSFDHVQSLRNKTVNSSNYNNQWEFNGYLQEKQQLLSEVLQDMAAQSNSYIYHENDVLYLHAFDFGDPDFIASEGVRKSLNEHDILDYKFTNQRELYDSFIIEYGQSSGPKKFVGLLKITPFETNFYQESNTIFDAVRDDGTIDNYDIDGYNIGTVWDKNDPASWIDPDTSTLVGKCQDMWLNHFHSSNPDKLRTKVIKADKLSNVHSVRRLMVSDVHKFTNPRPILEVELPTRHGDLNIGNLIYIDHTDFAWQNNSTYLIFGKKANYVEQTFTFKLLRVVKGEEVAEDEPDEPIAPYTIQHNITGTGNISPHVSKRYWYGDEVILTATPFRGWQFENWFDDVSGSTNPLTITITGNMTVGAYFTVTDAYDPKDKDDYPQP